MEKLDPSGLHLSNNAELVNEYLDEFGNIDITSTHLPGYSIFLGTTATDIQMGEKQEVSGNENVTSMHLETAGSRKNTHHHQAGMANSSYFASVEQFSGEDFSKVTIGDSSQGASISGNPHFAGFEDVLMSDGSPETVLNEVFNSEGSHEGVAIQAHNGAASTGNVHEDDSAIAATPSNKNEEDEDAAGLVSDVKELSAAQLDAKTEETVSIAADTDGHEPSRPERAQNLEVLEEENVGERVSIMGKDFMTGQIADQKTENTPRDSFFTEQKQHELPAPAAKDMTVLELSMVMQDNSVHYEKPMEVQGDACPGSDTSDFQEKEVVGVIHGGPFQRQHCSPISSLTDMSPLEVSMAMQGELVQPDKLKGVLKEYRPVGDSLDLQKGGVAHMLHETLEKQSAFPALEKETTESMTHGDLVQHDNVKEVQGESCPGSTDSLDLHTDEVAHMPYGSKVGRPHGLPVLEMDQLPLGISAASLGQRENSTQEVACPGSGSPDLPDREAHGSPGAQCMDAVELVRHGTSKESSHLGLPCDISEQLTSAYEACQSEDKPMESGSSDPQHVLVHSIEKNAEDLSQLGLPCGSSEKMVSAYEVSKSEDKPTECGSSEPSYVLAHSIDEMAEDVEQVQDRTVLAVEGTKMELAEVGKDILKLDSHPVHEHSLVATSQTETGSLTLLCQAAAADSLQIEQDVPSSGSDPDSSSATADRVRADNAPHEEDMPGSHAELISKQVGKAGTDIADCKDRKAILLDAQDVLARSTIITEHVDRSNESLGEHKGKQDVKEGVTCEGVELGPIVEYVEGEEDVKESCSGEGINTAPSVNTFHPPSAHPVGGAKGTSAINAAVSEAKQLEEAVHSARGSKATSSNAASSEANQMEEDINVDIDDAEESTKLKGNNMLSSAEIGGSQQTYEVKMESLLRIGDSKQKSDVKYESRLAYGGICDHKQTDEAEVNSLLSGAQRKNEAEENSLSPNVEIGDAKQTSDEGGSWSENAEIGDAKQTGHMDEDSSAKETSEGVTVTPQKITEVDDGKQTSDMEEDKVSNHGDFGVLSFKPGSEEAVGEASEHLGPFEGNLQGETSALLHVEEGVLGRQAGFSEVDKHAGGFSSMKKSYTKSKGNLSPKKLEKHVGGATLMKKPNIDKSTGLQENKHKSEQILKVGKDGASFTVGDLVWAKVKSHPWWPGMIFDVADASDSAKKLQRSGRILVAFFADCTFAWLHRTQMVPFEPNFKVKVKQTNMKIFCRAVIEALEEVCRRAELGFRCRHFEGDLLSAGAFPDTNAGIQKGARIMRHRDISQSKYLYDPVRTLQFVKAAACAPLGSWNSSPEVAKLHGHAYGLRTCMLVSERSKTDELLENMLLNIKGGKVKRKFSSLEVDEKVSMETTVGVGSISEFEKDAGSTKSMSKKSGIVAKKAKIDIGVSVRKILVGEKESETPGSLKSPSMKRSSDAIGKKVIASDLARGKSSEGLQLKRCFAMKDIEGNKKVKTRHETSIEKDMLKHSSQKGADSDGSSDDDSETLFALAGRTKLLKKIKKGKLQDLKHQKSAVDIKEDKEEALRESSIIAIGSPKKSLKHDLVTPAKSIGLGNCTRVLPLVEDKILLDTRKDEKKPPKTLATPVSLPQRKKVLEDTGKVDEVKQSPKVIKHPVEEEKNLDSPRQCFARRPAKFAKLGDCIRRIAGELSGTSGKVGDESLVRKSSSPGSLKAGLKEERDAKTLELSELPTKLKDPVNEAIDGMPDPMSMQLFDCLRCLARDPLNNAGMKMSVATIASVLKFRNAVFQKKSLDFNTSSSSVEHGSGNRDYDFDDSEPPNEFEAVTARKQPGVQNVTFKKTATQDLTAEARKRKAHVQEGLLRTSKKPATQGLRIVKPRANMDWPVEQRRGPERGNISSPNTKSCKKGGNDKVPLGPPFGLFMKFPRNFALPSEAQLKATFVRFGPIEPSETRVFRSTASAIVVFKHGHDAEIALKHAKEKSIFGKAAVTYRVREFVRKTDVKQDVRQTDKGKLPSRMEGRPTMQRHGERHTSVESKVDLGRSSNSADVLASTKAEDTRSSSPALNLDSLISNSKPSAADQSGDIQDKMMKLLRQVSVIIGGSSPISQDATPARAPQG